MKLICFPFAGGGSTTFRTWGKELGIEVVTPTLPGREARSGEPGLTRMPPLVADILARHARQLTGAYVLFGHSLGAHVAFALTRELARRQLPGPARVIVSGSRAPQLPSRFAPLHALPDAGVIDGLRSYGGTPQEVLDEPELLAYFLPILRADFAVAETYAVTVDETVACPIIALGGDRDSRVNLEELHGWRALTTGAFEAHVLAGGHFFVDERRSEVLAHIRRVVGL